MRSEKTGSILFHQQRGRFLRLQSGITLDPTCAGLQRHNSLLFESPNSGILKISILVYDRGEDDGHLPIVRGIQNGIRRLNLAVQIRTQHHPRISERFDQIDYEESRPLTESNSETKAPLSKEFPIPLCSLLTPHTTPH